MPGGYELLDSDEGRLPEGMKRVGYDADTEIYTYQDERGNYWQGEQGNRYGELHRTGTRGPRLNHDPALSNTKLTAFRAEDWRYMGPWFLIVAVVLLAVWYFFGPTFIKQCEDGLQFYRVMPGDTCWKIAESRATTVDELMSINSGLPCDTLQPGMQLCTP